VQITTITALILLAEPAASASIGAEASSSAPPAAASATAEAAAAPVAAAPPKRWILRSRPHDHELELGLFAGVLAPRSLALRAEGGVAGDYAPIAPDLGLRLGYYPSRFFGLEGELGLLPTRYADQRALLYTARAQAVIQAGWWRIAPFIAVGGGALGVRSDLATAAGSARAPELHFGGGVRFNINDRLALRVDVRDVVVPSADNTTAAAHSAEALLGFAVRFGVGPKPAAPEPPPPDFDGDGVADADDWCSHEAGDDEHGCPHRDGDCDGVKDNIDTCPAVRGVEPDGCPPPDGDGDGVADPDDACPEAAGPAPAGCPDVDGDGIEVPDDRCADAPETFNGFADADGCPDELPAEVQRFSGVITGIRFDTTRAVIRPESRPTLDQAVAVLAAYPDLRLEIVGHTDDRGPRERNLELSRARADAVRAYLVDHGIAGDRVTTRGAGPDEPIADNKSADGRAANRRIEFRVLPPPARAPG